MKSTCVTIHEAKTNLSKLIQKVASGEEVIIARGSQPVARLVAIEAPSSRRTPGSFKGKFQVGAEFLSHCPQQSWTPGNNAVRALLDTPAKLWWLLDSELLTKPGRKVIAERKNAIIVSAASAWEIATKVRLGKLHGAEDVAADFGGIMAREGFELLSISADHAIRAGGSPGFHRDPFDRMLIAQAQAEDLSLISNEAAFDQYGVRRIW